MCKRLLTKRNIFSDDRLGIKTAYETIPQMLLEYFESEEYILKIESNSEVYSIKYNADKFSLDDLKRLELPKNYNGGNGKKLLTEETNYFSYKYEDGWNIYELDLVKYNLNIAKVCKEFKISGDVSYYTFDITGEYSKIFKGEGKKLCRLSRVHEELILNILLNTKIIEKYYSVNEKYFIIYDKDLKEITRWNILGFKEVGMDKFKQKDNIQISAKDIIELANLIDPEKLRPKIDLYVECYDISEEDLIEIEKFNIDSHIKIHTNINNKEK